MWKVKVYKTINNKEPFTDWFSSLKDHIAYSKISVRLKRFVNGNFGDSLPVRKGISEIRVDEGPGYRVYFSKIDLDKVLILNGGTKKTQDKDIAIAEAYLNDYKIRKDIKW